VSRLPERVVLATRNPGKLVEARAILTAAGVREVLSMDDIAERGQLGEIAETGDTFEANALIKAQAVVAAFGLPAIGDDSGLVVDALDGEPGIRSARFAADAGVGSEGDSEANMALLLQRLADVPDAARTARFVCAAAYAAPGETSPVFARGACEGVITRARAGSGGFGYDPIFFVPELGVTMAQLQAAEKNMISHRAAALAALVRALSA